MTLVSADIIFLSLIAISAIFGISRGFFASFLSFIGWLLSFYLTFATYTFFEQYLSAKIESESLRFFVGHTLLLLFYLIVIGLINLIINFALKPVSKGVIDRTFGGFFGIGRAILLILLFCLVYANSLNIVQGGAGDVETFDQYSPEIIKKSAYYSEIVKYTDKLIAVSSGYISTKLDQFSAVSADERFVAYISEKIIDALPSDTLSDYHDDLKSQKENYADQDAAQLYQLNRLYKTYLRALDRGEIEQDVLIEKEHQRLRDILLNNG